MNDIASVNARDMVDFRLTGAHPEQRRPESGQDALTPVLLAPYAKLAELRYDYPLVLIEDGSVRALTEIFDAIVREIASEGIAGERTRKHALRLEEQMRAMVADGARGRLSELWDAAQRQLLAACNRADRALLEESLAAARSALGVDGEFIDCDEAGPGLLLRHLWSAAQTARRRAALEHIATLTLRLSDILRADALRSGGQEAEQLRDSVGERFRDAFDFDALAGLLNRGRNERLPEPRRRRISAALEVLQSQRFFATGNGGEPHAFLFDSLSGAMNALRDRLPEMVDLIKAMAIAELEIGNRYRESRHDEFFQHFDAAALTAEDLMFFPSYLVCLRNLNAREQGELMDALASGLPIKVLVLTDDILGAPARQDGQLDLGTRGSRLAKVAVALGDTWVLQSAASHLYQCREQIAAALGFSGPALFSVYDGSGAHMPQLPMYLNAAAAMQSRAFPAFAYDPCPADMAARFIEPGNPQPEHAWPEQVFSYEDEALRQTTQQAVFSFIDFVALDTRYASHFAPVSRDDWSDDMAPAHRCLQPDNGDSLPYVWLMDQGHRARRFMVDDKLIHAARRCHERWCVLQEYWGIDNSWIRAERARSDALREAEPEARQAAEVGPAVVPPAQTETAEPEPAASADPAAQMPAGDAPYIETPRCTTCDECTQLNDRMFAYDDNMQAYIKDLDAGTFRELVEAAENCQVSIIHPGQPRNPGEPGLDELIKRAEPFN